MALPGELPEVRVGESIKVSLPGESPWAACIAIHPDGTWDGQIINKLFGELSEYERARFMKDSFGTVKGVPKLHNFSQDQVVRFRREVAPDYEIWVPADLGTSR